VGDLTPHCGVSKEEKHAMEMQAMRSLVDTLGGTPVAEEIYQLWLEYEENKTNEAKFVKDLDKFEMIVQAFEYEKGARFTLLLLLLLLLLLFERGGLNAITHQTHFCLFVCLFGVVAQGQSLGDFFEGTKGKFRHPTVVSWVQELNRERDEFHAAKSQ